MTESILAAPSDWVEIRVLGPLRVRSADGQLIRDRDWRTGKNADLLRWLALEAGRPVQVETLIDGLWPDVDESRARASLRTAVSHLRRVLGPDSIERTGSDVVLRSAWVDAGTFSAMAEHVAARRREGQPAAVLAVAREADSLYLTDVPASEGTPEAIRQHASALAALHRQLLADAAELAVELGWMRDAVDYARRLLDEDPVSERASRALMLGYAGMGEVHHALAEYERCREVLAEELGVDPSSQTRSVHLQVLQSGGRTPERRTTPLVGRHAEVDWLRSVLEEDSGAGPAPVVVTLVGRAGSGRRRLAVATCQRAGLHLVRATTADDVLAAVASGARVVLWRPDPTADRALLTRILTDPASVLGSTSIVLAMPAEGEDPAWDAMSTGDHVRCLALPPLLPEDVERLAEHLLAGPVTAALAEALTAASDGLPGVVATTAQAWARAGRLVATDGGLALAPEGDVSENDPWGRRALARTLPRLEGDALEALLIAAVLDEPLTPSLLAPLLPDGPGHLRTRATAALEQLVDLAVLGTSPAGVVWKHPKLQDAARAWVRPSVRRRLHRLIAERALIPSAQRIGHWLEAGERELACVAALQAAMESSARGDHHGARTHLLQVCSLGDLRDAAAEDRIELFEQLGDACAMLRLPDEAADAYGRALEIAMGDAVQDAGRLRRKLISVSDPRALEQVATGRSADWSAALSGVTPIGTAATGGDLETSLREAVAQADRHHDRRAGFQARVKLAGTVYLPRREFRAVHETLEAAIALGPRPADRLHADVARHLPSVILGGARAAREPLEAAGRVAAELGEERIGWRLLGMRVLVAHDLGDPVFEGLWRVLRERVLTGEVDEVVPELAATGLRVLVEREEYDLAQAFAQHLPLAGGPANHMNDHLARIAGAELAAATGDTRYAIDQMRSVIDDGRATGCTLLVPEAAARLVALEAKHNPNAARAAFEIYDDIVGAALGGPREEFFRRMARAAVRAGRGDHQGAVDALTQASALANQYGLQVLAATARRARSEHVRAELPRTLTAVPSLAGERDEGVV
jgi:DNA-binding SARP family transcriptional activator